MNLDKLKLLGPEFVAHAIAMGWAKPGTPTGMSLRSLVGRKYRGTGHQRATLGGCMGERQRHWWAGQALCVHCGKPNPKSKS